MVAVAGVMEPPPPPPPQLAKTTRGSMEAAARMNRRGEIDI
jgi:hypothetical protein